MIKRLSLINVKLLLECFNSIESGIQWTDYAGKSKQVGLQFKDSEDPWTSAVGLSSGQELSCTNLNPFFKDTEFEKIIVDYKLKKTRLMWVAPYACYSMHKDETPRVHVPLITNPDAYFVFKNSKPEHLPAGFVHWVDTRLSHTFMNCSKEHRLHLVGAVSE